MSNLAPLTRWQPPGELRQKLLEMRAELLGRMQRRGAVEPAHLPLVAGLSAALEAIDRSDRPIAYGSAPAVVDIDGEPILLMIHNGDAVAATELSPVLAIRLGGELLAAAGERLGEDLALLRRKASR